MDQILKNEQLGFQNVNAKIKDLAKLERLFSDESASDCSPILKPSLPQIPTQNYQNNLLKNKVMSFSNISKTQTNTHVSLSPKTTTSTPQTPQKLKLDKTPQNDHTIGEEKNIFNQDKQKYFSHFRNQSNPCILNTSQQEFLDKNYIEGSCKTQSQREQNLNFQLNENQSESLKNKQALIKFTNPMIQSKVVSLQSTPKNSQQNTQNTKSQQNQSNQAINFTKSENTHGIHLFHNKNQQKTQMLKKKCIYEPQKKMNKTVFNLNEIIPNLYYINSSQKNEKDLQELIEKKKLQLKMSLTAKDTPLAMGSQKYINIKQSQSSTTNQFQYIQRQIRQNHSSQNIQKQNKVVFSNLLSQTFNNNFEQYDVIESGITRKLKQNIRQKSAISQSLNNSQVKSKNFSQQVSFEDDFQQFISKYQNPGSDGILGNQQFEKKQEDQCQNQIHNNLQSTRNQNFVCKSLYPNKSSLNKNHQSSMQNIFFKEQSKKVEYEENNNINNQNHRASSNLKKILNNQNNMNLSVKQNNEFSKFVKFLLNKEKNQQIEQFKMMNKSQSFAIKNKEDQLEKVCNFTKSQMKKNQIIAQSQKILLKQSNPLQLPSSTTQAQNQYNYILKKDLIFNKFLEQEKQRLKQ